MIVANGQKGAIIVKDNGNKSHSKVTTVKTEAQKKEAASVTPTMLSKQWQQFVAFQVMAIVTAECKTQQGRDLHTSALALYKKQTQLLVKKVGYYTHIDEFNVGDITVEQMDRTKGLDNFISGEKVWRKGKDVVCSLEKYLSMEGVRTLLKRHSKKLNNLQGENVESPDSTSTTPDPIESTFEPDSGDSTGEFFLKELLQLSQPVAEADTDVEVVVAPHVISVEYLIVKYLFVLADMCGYTSRVNSERNVVVR